MYSVRNSLLLFVLTLSFFAFSFLLVIPHASAATNVAADVVSDTTWTVADSPYIISNSIRVAEGTTLTIDPGVIVQFEYGTEIGVDGSLVANGTADQLIHITSISDKTLVVDESDTDESESIEEEGDEEFEFIFEPFAGDYAGFVFLDGSSGTFTNTEIRYASTAILSTNATLTFNNSSILNTYSGIDVVGGVFTMTQSTISMSEVPVLVDYSTAFTHSGNTFTDTTYNGIAMFGDPYGKDYTFTAGDGPYVLFSNPSFSAGTTLTIEPGVTLQSSDEVRSLGLVGAHLSALGTSESKIVFDRINLDVFNHAVATLKHTEIKNTFWSAINVWDYGSLDADAILIDSVPSDGINVFMNGSISLKNSTISNFDSGGIVVFNDASATITNSTIENGEDGIVAFNHAMVDVDHVTIKNYSDTGVDVFGTLDFEDTTIKMRMSEMSGGRYGMYLGNYTILDVSENSIHGNIYGAYADFGDYNLADNWWGDASGPKNIDTNPEGLGNEIYGPITFLPWRKRDPLLPSKTPILIVPGVLGTEISRPSTGGSGLETLWLDLVHNLTDIGDQFMDALQFGPDLKPIDTSLVLGDVIKKKEASVGNITFPLFNYTDGLIDEFKKLGYTENEDLFLFPYDWRYGVSDQTIDQLQQKITEIKDQTDSETVDVIAHSTGGLLVKKYVKDNPTDHHIGKAVFVGVPNTGAPKAIKALIQGDSFGVIPLAESEMKKIAENLSVVYDLSPSEQYFNQKGSYIKIIDQKFFTSKSRLLNFAESNSFITDDHLLNFNALTNAHKLHTAEFDNYDLRTTGVDLYSINGCKAGTMGNIVEVRSVDLFGGVHVSYNTPTKVPGDGTVPLESSTNLPIDTSHKFYALKADHAQMMSADGIRQQIVNLLTGSSLDTQNILTQDIARCKLKGRAISIYSPLSIDITDQGGNHAGFIAETESIENTIPNADFEIMGEHKFVYLPDDESQTYIITVKGTGNGTFTLTDATIDDNIVTQTQVFKNIPVTTALTGTFNLGDITLDLDTDGDGTIDQNLYPSLALDSEQSEDYNPQETEEPQEEEKTTTVTYSGGHGGVIIPTQTDPTLGHSEPVSESTKFEPIEFGGVISPPAREGDLAKSGRVLSIETRPRNSSEVTDIDQNLLSANASSSNFPINKKVILISIVSLGALYFVVRKFIQ